MTTKVEVTQEQVDQFLAGQKSQSSAASAEHHGNVAAGLIIMAMMGAGFLFLLASVF